MKPTSSSFALKMGLRCLSPYDSIRPGRAIFLCTDVIAERLKLSLQNYWLALVLSDELTPERLKAAGPGRNDGGSDDMYPVWLLGKQRCIWAGRSQMNYVLQNVIDKFTSKLDYDSLSTYYYLIEDQKSDEARIEFFADDVRRLKVLVDNEAGPTNKAEKRRRSRSPSQGLFMSEDENDNEENAHDDVAEQDDGEPSQRTESQNLEEKGPINFPSFDKVFGNPGILRLKKRRLSGRLAPFGSSQITEGARQQLRIPPMLVKQPSSALTPGPLVGTRSNTQVKPERIEDANENLGESIKKDVEEDKSGSADPDPEAVTIYVGAQNTEFYCTKTELMQSNVLASYLGGHSVLRTELFGVRPNDFEALAAWLRIGEYDPLLVGEDNDAARFKDNRSGVGSKDAGEAEKIVRWELDGRMEPRDYAREVTRSGRLYLLAERFKVPGFKNLIFRKVSLTLPQRYNIMAVMELATTIFTRPSGPSPLPEDNSGDEAIKDKEKVDELEEFLINLVAKDYEGIMKHQQVPNGNRKGGCELFWALVNKGEGGNRRFQERVLSKQLELIRKVPATRFGAA